MRMKIAAAVGALALGVAVLFGTTAGPGASIAAPTKPAADAPILVKPGEIVTIQLDGTIKHDRVQNTAITTEYRASACNVNRTWNSNDGAGHPLVRHMTGTVILRVPWARDDRGAGRDVSWINWNYNPPGSGPGEGTGISAENQTNYTLVTTFVEMRNIFEQKWQSAVTFVIPQDEKAHVMGHSDEDNIQSAGDFDAHSYWDNAPRVLVSMGSYNWGPLASEFTCSNYPSGQPST